MTRSLSSDILVAGVLAMLVCLGSFPILDILDLVVPPDYMLPLALIAGFITLWGWLLFAALHDIRQELRRLPPRADQPLPSTKEDPQ